MNIKRILFPTDFSGFSKQALKYALSFATRYGAKLYVLHVVESMLELPEFRLFNIPISGPSSRLEKRLRARLETIIPRSFRRQIEVVPLIRYGKSFEEIIRAAEACEADLIVMATHGRTGLDRVVFGSVAEKVILRASCPVLSIKHPEHEFVTVEGLE